MSKQRNFRPRAKLNHDEEEEGSSQKPAGGTASLAAAATPKPPAAPKPNLKPNLLSFEEDGEGEDAGRSVMPSKKSKDRSRSKLRGGAVQVPLPEIPVVTTSSQRSGAGTHSNTSDSVPIYSCTCMHKGTALQHMALNTVNSYVYG